MGKTSRIRQIGPEESSQDVLTEVLRNGCQKILKDALEVEIAEFLEQYRELRTGESNQRIVRNGYHRERMIQTGIGEVPAGVPRGRDQAGGPEAIKYSSKLLPPYLRRTKSIEDLLPWLYLKGISTGDFSDALTSLLGENARGLSATTISRLKQVWGQEHEVWSKRSLAGKQYVYV